MTDPFKKLINISFTALTLFAGISLDAQETANPIQNPPVNVEGMTGNRGVSPDDYGQKIKERSSNRLFWRNGF